jgi:acetyl-CoA carboxylase biotin carboxyl carrier protein
MEIREIQDIIKFVSRLELSEVEIAQGDFRITIKRELTAAPVMYAQPQMQQMPMQMPMQVAAAPTAEVAAAPTAAPVADTANLHTFRAPIIGTMYRTPKPDAPAFVEVGMKVKKGQVLCVIEAMKLFNEIESDVDGTIVKILVDNAKPVEYDQPLFLIDTSK